LQTEKIKKLLDNVESGSGMASMLEKTEGMKHLLAVSRRCRILSLLSLVMTASG
jgi:hypothetical protein